MSVLIALVGVAASPFAQAGGKQTLDRIHLRNGNVVDGIIIHKTNSHFVLYKKYSNEGQGNIYIAIRQVDHVEKVDVRGNSKKVEENPDEDEKDDSEKGEGSDLPDGPPSPDDDSETLERRLTSAVARIQDDFAMGATITIDGWVLALTEARLCALIALAG